MKKAFLSVMLLLTMAAVWSQDAVVAQENTPQSAPPLEGTGGSPPVQEPAIMTQEEFLARRQQFFLYFDEGLAASWNTRLIKQTGRSNFVFQDFLAGLYFTTRTKNLSNYIGGFPMEALVRVAAYYPLSHTFNDYPQPPVNMLNFGVDVLLAPVFQINFWNWAYLDLAVGPHFLYQKADRWHYVHLGAGGLVGVQLPLARRWTLLLNGIASIDSANLGSNRHMEPYDLAWQYQVSLGVRYSRMAPNPKSYIPSKKSDATDWQRYVEKQEKKRRRTEAR